MNVLEWCTNFVIHNCRDKVFDHVPNDDTKLRFELANADVKTLWQSDISVGRVVYGDQRRNTVRSKLLLLKTLPQPVFRTTFNELTFANEIFIYSKAIPFYASLNDSISNLFPKFYCSCLNFDDNEEGFLVLENLSENCRRAHSAFLDLDHVLLTLKKLGEFHAYSYQAKKTNPSRFNFLTSNLIETHWSVVKFVPNRLDRLVDHILDHLSFDVRYTADVLRIREKIGKPDKLMAKILLTIKEPMAVLCHGDFLWSNVLYEYDEAGNPLDLKFIDLADAKYCSPVIDLGLFLFLNTKRPMRRKYWNLFIQTYYDSLKNMFPDNDSVPSLEEIQSEFKFNVLYVCMIAVFFIPHIVMDETRSSGWKEEIFFPEYEEYVNVPFKYLPDEVIFQIVLKTFTPEVVDVILDVFRDVIDHGFI